MTKHYRTPTTKEIEARDYLTFQSKVAKLSNAGMNMNVVLGRYLALCCHYENDDRKKAIESKREHLNGIRKFFNNISCCNPDSVKVSTYEEESERHRLRQSLKDVMASAAFEEKSPGGNPYHAVAYAIKHGYRYKSKEGKEEERYGFDGLGMAVRDAASEAEDFDSFEALLRDKLLS